MAEPAAAPNASFRAALERVIDGERVVLATVIARIRIGLAVTAVVVGTIPLMANWRAYIISFAVSVICLVASLVIWRLLKTGKLLKRAGWMLPMLDLPLIAIAQVMQTPKLPFPWMGMVNTPAMMSGLLVPSVLSLSRPVILASAAIGLVPIITRAVYVNLAPTPFAFTVMSFMGITAVLLALVTRIRGLVHTSRAQDLLGKYVLGRRLGIGGMAEVFEATYSPEGGFERRVAVKRILPQFADQQVAKALFRQEAEVGAMLAHPGVVQVLDYGIHQGTSFLAMEYIDGVSLKDLINSRRAVNELLPLQMVMHIAWQLTEALDYIHGRVSNTGRSLNLVHRDLNPPNIMLTRIGDAKLADFGIAIVSGQERMTAAGVMRGKLGYAAPEQVTGNTYDGRADLFALGLTLHECLVGNRVFRADSEMELMRVCLEGPIVPPSVLRADVPPAIDELVMGLLQRDLAVRTPSADELRRQLVKLPRELLDLQTGRKLLSAAVFNAQEWVKTTAPANSGTTPASTQTMNDMIRTATHAAVVKG